jgi:hypothetical protein
VISHFYDVAGRFVAGPGSADSSSGRRMLPVSAMPTPATPALVLHQLTDTWYDLAAVQFDVGYEGLVG